MRPVVLRSACLLALLLSSLARGQTGVFQGKTGPGADADDVVATAAYAPSGEEFSIKQEDPDLGSNIRRKVVTLSLPFDKKWGEMTPKQQAIQRALYDHIPADQEPPFPANGLYDVYKPVSDVIEMYARGGRTIFTGELDLGVIVDPDGQVDSIAVHEAPDRDMARSMAQALVNVSFKPGLCAGKPCRMEFPVIMTVSRRDRAW